MGECKRVLRFDTYLFFSLCVCSRNGVDCHELWISVCLMTLTARLEASAVRAGLNDHTETNVVTNSIDCLQDFRLNHCACLLYCSELSLLNSLTHVHLA